MGDINWHSFFFLFFGAFVCAFALAVVFTNNIVRMAFYLVISLGATAGLFFLAGASFGNPSARHGVFSRISNRNRVSRNNSGLWDEQNHPEGNCRAN